MILAILVVLVAVPATPVRADTTVCGPIGSNTTWTPAGNNHIVTCDTTVNVGVTLTIQPGVVVKFDPGASLRIDGALIARGCKFTSNAAVPAKGDWGRIHFSTTSVDASFDAGGNYMSGSIIQGCTLEWGGGGTGIRGMLETNLASPLIDDNIIQNSRTTGIYALGRSNSTPVVIRQNEISSNDGYFSDAGGVYISSGKVVGNTISNNRTYGGEAGGIYAIASTISSNLITANQSPPSLGGGIRASGSTITGNTIIGNEGGGINASNSTMQGNQIADNSAGIGCGGATASGNSTIANNTISGNYGGGVCAIGGTVSGNTVTWNVGSEGGGVNSSAANVIDNIIADNTAVNGGGIFAWNASSLRGNTVTDNHATNEGGGVFMADGTTAANNQVSNNSAAKGGGWYASSSPPYSTVNMTANTVQDNEANLGGGIYAVNSIVRGNTVRQNHAQSDGGGIYAEGGTVRENAVSLNTVLSFGHGSGAYLVGATEFTYNDLVNNTAPGGTAGGLSIDGQTQIHYNNLYNNQPYDAEVVSLDPVDGTLNYWGPALCTQIPGHIYDGHDAPGRGNLAYAPSLYAAVPLAQLPVPTNLTHTVTGSTVALDWLPIPDLPDAGCRVPGSSRPDLGYRLYYDTDSPCAPFAGTGLNQGSSPIDIGAPTAIDLSNVPAGRYYFVVTAHDYLGRESSFSNVIAVNIGARGIYLPAILRQ
jgi:hypothetical protein